MEDTPQRGRDDRAHNGLEKDGSSFVASKDVPSLTLGDLPVGAMFRLAGYVEGLSAHEGSWVTVSSSANPNPGGYEYRLPDDVPVYTLAEQRDWVGSLKRGDRIVPGS
jgi:hypothetical protein